jgi:hypothetical protein
MSAGGLAGCGSIDELSEGWITAGTFPIERKPAFPEDAPSVTQSISPEYRLVRKLQEKQSSQSSEKTAKSARKPQRLQTGDPPNKQLTSAPVAQQQGKRPELAEPHSASTQPQQLQLRLKTPDRMRRHPEPSHAERSSTLCAS